MKHVLKSSRGRGAHFLMNVQKTQEEEEGGMDPEALERKRLQEAEAWRLEQLRAGTSSEENANFQVQASALLGVRWLKVPIVVLLLSHDLGFANGCPCLTQAA